MLIIHRKFIINQDRTLGILPRMTMQRIDMHCHTNASGDCGMQPARLLAVAHDRGLHRLCITDHNSVRTGLELAARAPELVVPGIELLTTKGELLAYFVTAEVPARLEPLRAIDLLRAQGAVISVSHPFDHKRGARWSAADLAQILPHVDALETFNARCVTRGMNPLATLAAFDAALPATAGSDAHGYSEVGIAGLLLPDFANANELCTALRSAQIFGRRSSVAAHLASRWAALRSRASGKL